MTTPFIEDNDQTRARREHLREIQKLVGNVYPNKFKRSRIVAPEHEDTITAIVEKFSPLAPKHASGERPAPEVLERVNAELKEYGDVCVAGRLAVPPRVMGKAAFVHLSDGVSRMQIYVRRDDVRGIHNDDGGLIEEGWQLFGLLDHGDFIGVEGYLFVTKTGELSIHVRSFQFLAKALLPMPDKLHGISDPEIRQRQRYADLIAGSLKIDKDDTTKNATKDDSTTTAATTTAATTVERELTPREVFELRSKFLRELRRHLDDHGYIEVETPMLTPIASGAAARPFKTHHNALGIDLYARIAPELYLKRLIVGGFERVYELNRNFRNEGIDRTHNPEFTMLEFYCAYMDVNGMMDFCEELLRFTIEKVTGGTRLRFEDEEFDFGSPFQRLTMKEAIINNWPSEISNLDGQETDETHLNNPKFVDIFLRTIHEINHATIVPTHSFRPTRPYVAAGLFKEMFLENYNKETEPINIEEAETAKQIAELFELIAEEHLNQPTFIYSYPKSISPLSKASPDDPMIAERFELYMAGMECANGFSELNDPVEQYERFREQAEQRERGDEEAMQMDVDYVHALAYGMPPAAGIGLGIDRLVMLLTNRRSIRDVILFPHMRPQARQTEEATTDGAAVEDETA
ncbi:MAG TPA: lysine--tRNA ligase [Pyrinomonadaceae bacterium]|jgi:lysyl-tRNA synthetase class 2